MPKLVINHEKEKLFEMERKFDIIATMSQTIKVLIRLHRCGAWSAPLTDTLRGKLTLNLLQ